MFHIELQRDFARRDIDSSWVECYYQPCRNRLDKAYTGDNPQLQKSLKELPTYKSFQDCVNCVHCWDSKDKRDVHQKKTGIHNCDTWICKHRWKTPETAKGHFLPSDYEQVAWSEEECNRTEKERPGQPETTPNALQGTPQPPPTSAPPPQPALTPTPSVHPSTTLLFRNEITFNCSLCTDI